MSPKPRLAKVVLAVLSSITLTLLVVVPLALGARSARSDTLSPAVANVTRSTSVVSPPVVTPSPFDLADETDDDGSATTVPTDPDGSDRPGSGDEVPKIAVEVLPRTEDRVTPVTSDPNGTTTIPDATD